jgi:hypothetical protein
MKVSLSILIIFAFIIPSFGQAMVIRGSGNNLKGAPFSAEAISENVQTLADGNRIIRRSVTRLYRDSEGRMRREEMPTQLGVPGAVVDIPRTISINDPVSGTRYTLYPKDLTYHESRFRSEMEIRQQAEQRQQQREAERQVREQDRAKREEERSKQQPGSFIEIGPKETAAFKKFEVKTEVKTEVKVKVETKTDMEDCDEPKNDPNRRVESLGSQNIEGVMAEGTRTTTIIPAGKVGNEQPIEVVYEKWYSSELQMIVYSKLTDPRVGVQVYHLTNINRVEQPINLFQPPPDYRLVSQTPPKPPAIPKNAIPAVKPVPARPAELKKT